MPTMRFAISLIVLCPMLAASPAAAEWFADAYAGYSLTVDSDVTVHSPSGLSIYRDVEYDRAIDNAYIIGARFGRYFDFAPFLGVGVDLFKFSPTIGPQQVHIDGCVPSGTCAGGQGGTTGRIDVSTVGVSLDLMLRLPLLKTDKSPWGTLNPYILAGVPVFITTVTPRTTAQFRNHDADTDVSVGYKVGGGLAFQVAPNLMLFAEYRYIHSEASVDLRDSATLKKTPVRLDFDTHAGIFGLSARW
jgi:opacity protein-like surface antigen